MTILYKVQNNDCHKETYNTNKVYLCKVSVKNIIAFSALTDADNNSRYKTHINVCDVVTPWQWHRICSSKNMLTVLEWSPNGELLLVGYKGGSIEIWASQQHVLNSWQLLYKATFANENIINSKFFHNGKSTYFYSQKKESPFYGEKFDHLEHRPTLQQFGCSPIEGCLTITSSGLLGVFTTTMLAPSGDGICQKTTDLNIVTHSLGLSRTFLTFSSITHCSNGSFNIAIICDSQDKLIKCYSVSLRFEKDNIIIKCEALASIFLGISCSKQISHLKWATFNKENIIFVIYDYLDGSIIEQWSFVKKNQSVHKLLQRNKNEFIQNNAWEKTGQIRLPAVVGEICISKLHSDQFRIYVVLTNNTVQFLEFGLKQNGLIVSDRFTNDRIAASRFASADISSTNQILWIIDNCGQLYAIQTSNTSMDKNTFFQQLSLLEYCIITGVDASDILMLNMGNLEGLIEKLTENFARQPAFTKHFYYSNFLSLKSNMCRVQCKQQDFDNLIILHSISITFKSLLRPSDLTCQDKGPADNLSMILSEPLADVDKVLFNLDAKDFTVEPLTLQSLQHLIQWVADLALNILNKLPDEILKTKLNKKQGYDISRDIGAIGSMRELLVMIRIWGLLNPHCLPIYTKSVENVDILSIIFRLLTRLAQNVNEPDELLVDECCLLSTQVLIPSRHANILTTLFNVHITQINKSFPLLLTNGVEPFALQDVQYEQVVFSNGTKDCVSNLHLGSKTKHLRKCVRCGFVNSLRKVTKTLALKAWCNRWLFCHCGGYWQST